MASPTLVQDRQLDFIGGQDASKVPDRVPENAYYAGVNITTKNGVLGPREGFDRKELIFPDGDIVQSNLYKRSYIDVFRTGKFQAIAPYTVGPDYYNVVVIAGVIFTININTYEVAVIDIKDGSNFDETADRINWSAAGPYLVFFDFPNYPVIFDGSSARRANPEDDEVPISVLGAYNSNRLFIANAGADFTAGDPYGSTLAPDAPISFKEVLTIASPYFGQVFQLPTANAFNPITGMAFLQTIDTSTGIGSLLVSTRNSVYSYVTQQPRASWQAGQFGALFIQDAGFAGPRAFTNVNSDLFFVASDGQVRTASMSRDEQNRWSRTPISREVHNWLKYIDLDLAKFASIAYFNNKIFITANPYRTGALSRDGYKVIDYTNGGMVVIEMDDISTLSSRSAPSWAGLWTGVRPMDFCVNNNRMFIMSKDGEFSNRLYEVNPDTKIDTADNQVRRPRGIVYTREYDWRDSFQNKETHSMDVALDKISGKFSMEVAMKPSHSSKFLPWKTFLHEAPTKVCKGIPTPKQVNGLDPHQFREVNLGYPKAAEDNL